MVHLSACGHCNMTPILFTLVFILIASSLTSIKVIEAQRAPEGSVYTFSGNLNTTKDIVWPGSVASGPLFQFVQIDVKISYTTAQCSQCKTNARHCCPGSFLYSWDILPKDKFNSLSCEQKLVNFTTRSDVSNYYYIKLEPSNWISQCQYVDDGKNTECITSMSFGGAVWKRYSLTFGSCESNTSLSLTYNITMRALYQNVTCTSMDPDLQNDLCADAGYDQIAMPGSLGADSQRKVLKLFVEFSSSVLRDIIKQCYQHVLTFGCRSFMPECRNGIRYFPCRQMCFDAYNGCGDILGGQKVKFSCNNFLDSLDEKLCFYREIQCPNLTVLNGYVDVRGNGSNATATYHCYPGYDLDKHDSSTRKCLYSGEWSGKKLTCSVRKINPKFNMKEWHIILIITGAMILAGTIVFFFWLYRRRYRLPSDIKLELADKIKYDGFISYSSKNADFVEVEFREWLEVEHKPPFKLCLHGRDFLPGDLIQDNIMKALENSATCLIMLSRDYLESGWCSHEFSVAHSRMVTERLPSNSLILVFLEDIPREELTPSIRAYTYAATYIRRDSPCFKESVVAAMKRARKMVSLPEATNLWENVDAETEFLSSPVI